MRTGQRIDARATQTASAVFHTVSLNESSFNGVAQGLGLTKARFVFNYQGDLQGEGVLEELRTHFPDGNILMTGLQQVTASLGDHSGTFVLNHNARLRGGMLTGRHIVVPGSATGGLKGLRGKMLYHSEPAQKISVSFQYYFA